MSGKARPRLPTHAEVGATVPLPERIRCIYVSGSLAAGWGHSQSDVDVFVVSDVAPALDGAFRRAVRVGRGYVNILVLEHGDVRWDVEYWSPAEIDELLGRFEDDSVLTTDSDRALVDPDEVDFLYRLGIGVPLLGEDWLTAIQRRLASSNLRKILTRRLLTVADGFIEDAVGLLDVDDMSSASLAARAAWWRTVDAFLVRAGYLSPDTKWRARQVQAAAINEFTYEEYWQRETMHGYADETARDWILETVGRCRDLILDFDVG